MASHPLMTLFWLRIHYKSNIVVLKTAKYTKVRSKDKAKSGFVIVVIVVFILLAKLLLTASSFAV